jgi:endonuclease/exonuclease/phosphatase family metal-dependent hydrolase
MALVVALLTACKDEPVADSARLELSQETVNFPSDAATMMVTVNCNRDFTAAPEEAADHSWCTVNVLAGQTHNLSISVTANEDAYRERTAKIIISAEGADSRYLTVRQVRATPQISVKETQVILYEAEGFDFSLEVTANISVVFDLPTWITHQSGDASATGAQTHTFTATPLDDEDTLRDSVITVKAADPSFADSIAVVVRQSNKNCVLRVATYNIRCGGCGDDETTGKTWYSRRLLIRQIIQTNDFDIFGVQEAKEDYWNQITDLIAGGNYSYTGKGCDDGGRLGFHNPVIYKTAKFDLLESGDFWYSDTPDVPSNNWDGGLNRSCSWGKFREKLSGRTFYFFCSHLSAENESARNKSAILLKEKIAAIAADSPVFAVGDYNTTLQSTCIQNILNGDVSALFDTRVQSEALPTGSLGTFNGFTQTPAQMGESLRFDYIFVNHVRVIKEYHVLGDRPGGAYPSDHDPVFIIAELDHK